MEKSLKELYILLLVNFKGTFGGICCRIWSLYYKSLITKIERDKLFKHFQKSKPSIFSKFYWNKSYTGNIYWWKLNGEGNSQRIKFIEHTINNLN